MKSLWIIVALVVIIAAGGFFLLSAKGPAPTPTPTPIQATPTPLVMEKTFPILVQNDSGVSGSAILREENGKVTVTLSLTGGPKTTPQPAHIHAGSCPDVGDVKYPLTNAVDGQSQTGLDVTLDRLEEDEPLAINVHKSAAQANVYVACGDLQI